MVKQRNANQSVCFLFQLGYLLSQLLPRSGPPATLQPPFHCYSCHAMVSDSHLTLSSFLFFFCFFPPHCISIYFHLLPPQIIWREGAGRVWGVTEESFWVHKWFNGNWLQQHSSAQGNHTHLQHVIQFKFLSSFIYILALLYPVIFPPVFWFNILITVEMFLSSLTICTLYLVDSWRVKQNSPVMKSITILLPLFLTFKLSSP